MAFNLERPAGQVTKRSLTNTVAGPIVKIPL